MDWTAIRRASARLAPIVFAFAVATAAGCGDSTEEVADVEVKICQQTCAEASDCGEVSNWQCVDGFCRATPEARDACQNDRQCWARFSGWTQADCRVDVPGGDEIAEDPDGDGADAEECAHGESCVAIGQTTYCAPMAPAREQCPVGTPYDAELADGSGRVAVCANQRAACDEGTCRDPCGSDADCAGERTCDVATGTCRCGADSDCSGPLVCDDGECVCEEDADCTREGADTCYDGTCGCADDASCMGMGDSVACAPVPEE